MAIHTKTTVGGHDDVIVAPCSSVRIRGVADQGRGSAGPVDERMTRRAGSVTYSCSGVSPSMSASVISAALRAMRTGSCAIVVRPMSLA